MTAARAIKVTVNGVAYERTVEPRLLLSDFLRHTLGLTGTHVGCEHGVCGACTVFLDGDSVRSCLTLAVQALSVAVLPVYFALALWQPTRALHDRLAGTYLVPR